MHPFFLIPLVILAAPSVETLTGSCVDGWTGRSLAGVVLKDPDGVELGRSDSAGQFVIDVPVHLPQLIAIHPHGDHERTPIHIPRDQDGRVLATPIKIPLLPLRLRGPPSADAFGLPARRPRPDPSTAIRLYPSTWAYTLPSQMPATIRVLRCPSTTCCTAPGDGIETLGFEDYVKGVVNAEVGVFRNVSTVDGQAIAGAAREAGSAEVFKTLAVSSRSYAMWWYLRRQSGNPGYDIRDGTCEQVYDSPRHAWVSAAVDATQSEILSSPGGSSIDKYEYASSCKRLGTLPHGTSAGAPTCNLVIPDLTGVVACAGSWCGHDTSDMGHQAHPCDSGRCRCLVRGICQWGAAERSYAGEPYTDILAHYQPAIDLIQLGTTSSTGKLVGYIREGDILNTAGGIAGVLIQLDSGQTATSNARGYYEISGLMPSQTVQVTASATGFSQVTDSTFLDPAYRTWWKSMAMLPETGDASATDLRVTRLDSGGSDQAAAVDAPLGDSVHRVDSGTAERSGGNDRPDSAIYDKDSASGNKTPPAGCSCDHKSSAGAAWMSLALCTAVLRRRRSPKN